jgi:hypothetical protein
MPPILLTHHPEAIWALLATFFKPNSDPPVHTSLASARVPPSRNIPVRFGFYTAF